MAAHPGSTPATPPTDDDCAAVRAQLGRMPRGLRAIAHRCPCGLPDVVETAPRLEDGTPFPTLYYLTCPRAASAIGTLESEGVMKEMNERLASDPELAAGYRKAHEDYLRRRDAIEELKGFPSAGGMPDRVKCLHVLVGHALAAGPGVNPLGDEALAMLPEWWRKGPCVSVSVPGPSRESGEASEGGAAADRWQPGSEGATRVAVIDCGTNSIRLLIADVRADRRELHDLDRRMEIVRLGQDVDKTGRFAPEALERTFAACRSFASVVRDLNVDRVRFIATSASRDVSNREEFVRGVEDIFGVTPEVISGEQEAWFSYVGATSELRGRDDVPGPHLVVDIGGGSTEFVVGDDQGCASRSMDLGCVRMTERHLMHDGQISDPPTPEQIAAIRAEVDSALDTVAQTVPLHQARTLVGLAGSVTTIAAVALGLTAYDSTVVHHARITLAQVREITAWLLSSTHAERAANPVIHPGRVDVIAAGALILLGVMERIGASEVLTSEHDILDGIGWSVA